MRNHSTISRRDFMKAMGLGTAGIGAAAASIPVFKDLDDIASGGSNGNGGMQGGAKFPWWIKQREHYNPTVEVDWDLKQRVDFKHGYSMGPGGAQLPMAGPSTNVDLTIEEEELLVKTRLTAFYEGLMNKTPGGSLRDQAFVATCGGSLTQAGINGMSPNALGGAFGRMQSNLVLGNNVITPEMAIRTMTAFDLGVPRWEGTPEENLNMLRVVANYFGSPLVGALDSTAWQFKKMPYATFQGRQVVWDDEIGETVDNAYQDAEYLVIPRSHRWVLVAQNPQSGMTKNSRTLLGGASSVLGYADQRSLESRLASFIAALGYKTTHSIHISNPGLGILGGLGELGRHDYLVSPIYGSNVRQTTFIFTNLPLTPTPPIDAGMWRFCHTCKKCADVCPGNSISHESKPTWEITGKWNGVGNNSWHIRYDRCLPQRGTPGGMTAGGCQNCMGNCVFTKKTNASVHEIIKMTAATTGIFNGFFRVMDDFFGYGETLNPSDFWDIEKMDSFPFNGYGAGIQ